MPSEPKQIHYKVVDFKYQSNRDAQIENRIELSIPVIISKSKMGEK